MSTHTTNERVTRLNAKRRTEGWRQFTIWTPPDIPTDELKALFPGPNGGVDWKAVITAALTVRRQAEVEKKTLPSLAEFRASLPMQPISAGEFCRAMRDGERY